MKLRGLLKGIMLVTVSSLLIAAVTLFGIFAFVYYNMIDGQDWSIPVSKLSDTLTWDGTDYTFTGEQLLKEDQWTMLLDEQGQMVWEFRKPEDVPEQYHHRCGSLYAVVFKRLPGAVLGTG